MGPHPRREGRRAEGGAGSPLPPRTPARGACTPGEKRKRRETRKRPPHPPAPVRVRVAVAGRPLPGTPAPCTGLGPSAYALVFTIGTGK